MAIMKRTLSFAVLLAIVSSVLTAPGGSASVSVLSASPSVAVTAPARAATRPTLILRADGLAVRARSGRVRHLHFGATSAQVTMAVKNVLGTGKTSQDPECGQGPRSTYQVKGFSLLFNGKKFVGWTDQGALGRRLAAADGTGVGITLARMRALHPKKITVVRDSLGPEFSHAGKGIDGLLNGIRRASRVTTVFAGETCFFR